MRATGKDFRTIARILAMHCQEMKCPVYDSMCGQLADLLAKSNPTFDRQRFIDTCNTPPEEFVV